ncbi:MAG: hypothetical protein ACLP01_31365 [Solirubrobacteraceae bacterium]
MRAAEHSEDAPLGAVSTAGASWRSSSISKGLRMLGGGTQIESRHGDPTVVSVTLPKTPGEGGL